MISCIMHQMAFELMPRAGTEEFYIHFGIDITEYAAERLIPRKCADTAGGCALLRLVIFPPIRIQTKKGRQLIADPW